MCYTIFDVYQERRTHLQDTGINEEYLDKIFRGDCFGVNALTKTVAIFRKTEFGDTLAQFNGMLKYQYRYEYQ